MSDYHAVDYGTDADGRLAWAKLDGVPLRGLRGVAVVTKYDDVAEVTITLLARVGEPKATGP
jgi:hypothetical protein